MAPRIRPMRLIAASLCLSPVLFLNSCAVISQDFVQNRLLWESRNIARYEYTLQISCFCVPELIRPVIIEVLNGEPVAVTDLNSGEAVTTNLFEGFDTLERLFDLVFAAMTQPVNQLIVEYDSFFGFPILIFIDESQQVADDQRTVTVSDFMILEG